MRWIAEDALYDGYSPYANFQNRVILISSRSGDLTLLG